MENLKKKLAYEVSRRKTFAIISHPDAGKTTLTEKLLLYGGALRMAGSVKARKTAKHAVSDWMEIEKQRGISVTSSVMQFEYNNYCINILDTPGHQDFSEDTYRTLMACDSAVMIIDGAKGVEAQTIKLFQVCKLRGIPIFTFINKMDRATKDPFALMEEIEDVLGIRAYPMNWPIGIDGDFKGVYNRKLSRVELFNGGNHGQTAVDTVSGTVDDKIFCELLGDTYHKKLCEDIELLDIAGDEFKLEKVLNGTLTPMFFGSAMTNFGVEIFLQEFLNLAPSPCPKNTSIGEVSPTNPDFSGFVFKIQANMNPTHRDRIAFIRICSGKFQRGMSVYQTRTKKEIKLKEPQQFMACDRVIVDEAYAGDIVGIFDPGIFNIGDSLCSPSKKFDFDKIPTFPAEHFARVSAKDTMKRKQFQKGLDELSKEGSIQVFYQNHVGMESVIVGTVGVLQFEVLEYRLKNEYNVDIRLQRLPHKQLKWIANTDIDPDTLSLTSSTLVVSDEGKTKYALICENDWSIGLIKDRNKGLELIDIY